MARILWIEGKRAESPQFISDTKKAGYHIELVTTGREALERLPAIAPHLIVLNAASMRTSGIRICHLLRTQADSIPVLVIADPNFELPSPQDATTVLLLPFTSRKLLNRIDPFIPWESRRLLHVGPIRLDMERKQVRCMGKFVPLTPRLIQLLKFFMEHPGEALVRDELFREVWATDYAGDTRTLDVHISWLRQAIETDPRHPKLLKTIRGVGYRLDV